MGANSKIEWTDHTFNPWQGCSKVSEGCKNCYAEERNNRFRTVEWGEKGTRKRTSDANWRKPILWNRIAEIKSERHRVFCASLADVFENRPELWPWRDDLFRLILKTPHLDWLLLTKRPENAHSMILDALAADDPNTKWPNNLWIGTSVENQEQADKRIPELLKVPAIVRFLSMEPLLGPVDLSRYIVGDDDSEPWICDLCGGDGVREYLDAPEEWGEDCPSFVNHLIPCRECMDHEAAFRTIHWVIVGGESGRNARPMHPDWARSLRDQCQVAGVPFHFKQWGEWRHCDDMDEVMYHEACQKSAWIPGPGNGYSKVGKHAAGRILDGRTWDELPEVHP